MVMTSQQEKSNKDPERANGTSTSPDASVLRPPVPPDGGYGWVICAASFLASVILDGVCFSFGIFYIEFLDYYGSSKAKTSWVGSVLNGMYLSMGPLVGGLANKFGCRRVAIIGSLMASASLFLSTFSPNIDVLIFVYGALGGFGFGLMYLPAIVMVGYYFEKRRALATGIAVCGSGIGAFVFAPMCEKLLEWYDWKGATWIISGIILHGCVLGALYRPLEHEKAPRTASPPSTERKRTQSACEQRPKELQPRDILRARVSESYDNSTGAGNGSLPEDKLIVQGCQQSMGNLNSKDTEEKQQMCMSKSCDEAMFKQIHKDKQREDDLKRPMYRKDIFYSGSIDNLPEYKENPDVASYVQSVTSIPRDQEPEKKDPCARFPFLKRCKSCTDTISEMLDFSLLTDPVFCVYGFSCFLCMAGFYIPFTYLPHHATKMGLSLEEAAFLLSIIGIANTIARVLCGYVSDQPWADCLVINNVALMMGGLATILCPFCYNYAMLAIYSAVFGVGIAVFVSLRSIIMVDLMGLGRLTNAFGMVTMCQGLSAFIGAPIAGALYGIMGDYSLSFYMAGISLFLAGAINIPLRRLARWQKEKRLKDSGFDEASPVEISLMVEESVKC
ncbi:hypothetical protein CAPTEDRAFT_171008 [Capitella teleta]|uniref:Major facilitator superfamily (MFS) profile domain-containing protein n=1 Tax=Capitella teleta TaxID=283909 RepID=R7TUC1_CAPTE|nr:hypothetical protein CAPTEDRAFT_171008 [Capitella teleta]|eukprot:ELT97508.1 hypothetical protein CAPTEDRAFT_171008 [Capitella teleta]